MKLYRIKDTVVISGLINRFYNLDDIVIYYTDVSHNELRLECLEDDKTIDDLLNKQIDASRGEVKTILSDLKNILRNIL